MNSTPDPQTDRPRALHLLEAADFLRDAHRDGLSVQEAITALRHMADDADPMVGSLARDGFGLDEIAAMPAAPVTAPPTGQADEELAKYVTRAIFALKTPSPDGSRHYQSGWDDGLEAAMDAARDAVLLVLADASEPHRLALSTTLGLGTSAPWDAIRERAAELAGQAVAVDRSAVLRDAAGLIEARQDRLDAEERAKFDWLDHETVLQGAAVRDMAAYLREQADDASHLAAETPGPETQGEAPSVCEGFVWIGQSFATCDRCGQPAWDHEGEEVAVEGAGPFGTGRAVRPWKPGMADAIRAKWALPGTEQPAVVAEPGKEA